MEARTDTECRFRFESLRRKHRDVVQGPAGTHLKRTAVAIGMMDQAGRGLAYQEMVMDPTWSGSSWRGDAQSETRQRQ